MHAVDGKEAAAFPDDFVRSAQQRPVLLAPPKGLHPAGTNLQSGTLSGWGLSEA
jgi:hypothetical protein